MPRCAGTPSRGSSTQGSDHPSREAGAKEQAAFSGFSAAGWSSSLLRGILPFAFLRLAPQPWLNLAESTTLVHV